VPRVLARILVAGAIAGLVPPQVVLAAEPPPEPPESPQSSESLETLEPPRPGSRGELELGLGVLLTGTGAGLLAFGAVQLVRAREHVEFCNAGPTYIDELGGGSSGIDPCRFDPPALGFASAGLSWTFSAALFVGAGLLLARGVKLQRKARRHDRQAVWRSIEPVPWWQASGGGITLRWRF
jgi:hypothetical protein